jgi:hypothetical protein
MTDIAERNRQIKKVLEQAFGRGNVTVRGTAYGWVRVRIGYAPRNSREARELRLQVTALIAAAKIEIGTYGYDDPGSDYGHGSTINIDFAPWREKADAYGPEAWRQNLSAEEWDRVTAERSCGL